MEESRPEWHLIVGSDVPNDAPPELHYAQDGNFEEHFKSPLAQAIAAPSVSDGHPDRTLQKFYDNLDYSAFINNNLTEQHSKCPVDDRARWLLQVMCLGVSALRAFLQASITGPPLSFLPEELLLPAVVSESSAKLQKNLVASLSVDGESAYHLAPHIILLVLARAILNSPIFEADDAPPTARWWRLRVNSFHQKVLSEKTGTLQRNISKDLDIVGASVVSMDKHVRALFLVERAMVEIYYGNDVKALRDLEAAAELTGLQYALTGIMGKRTKFQMQDTSQLVVLAKSLEEGSVEQTTKPQTLDLNDDTLLESISFTDSKVTSVKDDSGALPQALRALDPNEQPPLRPLDATILLLFTETIKNTNPEDGITREEMLPYAQRVLSHSTNWEVYTLGLLVRSRIEGTRARTVERGVLQLQVVVDQIIASTTGSGNRSEGVSTFLPRPKENEAAPIRERLLYIHQLPIPTRWELEAELASRWANIGGLRTSLEIYERLEMWPEAALCWAATDREDKAREIIRNQLYDPTTGEERAEPPPQAPRLWCILGDIDQNPELYEKAWIVSGQRYPRAQRSLGRYYLSKEDREKAAEAYVKSIKIFPLHGPSWFALGCCWLEMQRWEGAALAFRRVVALDDTDAEAWSNMATALLRQEVEPEPASQGPLLDDEEEVEVGTTTPATDPQRNKKDALQALKHACKLKRDSWRIWDNYLTVAASIQPPAYNDMVIAMGRLIKLRGGESAIDVDILELLVSKIVSDSAGGSEGSDPAKPVGLVKMVVDLVEKDVIHLITTNARLWRLVARMELFRKRPRAALDAYEKAWRTVNSRPGITDATEKEWEELVDETIDMVGAYESLGPMERTEGLGAGEPVAKDWRFKARSALRSVIGKGKANWEGTSGWNRLKEALEDLKP